ncbi:MAG: peptide-methionine (S)-S-oxide reductase MsrA [Rickettsiales bacterium]|nr:peptide-methionine (S)-S-oxide reductase MsrA [Rickettsiales bacterium]
MAEEATKQAIFAGGCFWCTEAAFDAVEGVTETTSGYTGGHVENPSYEAVGTGRTGHAEALRVTYDPTKVSYDQLLEVFWRSIDPTDKGGQFYDRGPQYRTAIFVQDAEERAAAEASKVVAEERLGVKIVTTIEPAGPFYPAEAHHQNYHQKHPLRFKAYHDASKREDTLRKIWQSE